MFKYIMSYHVDKFDSTKLVILGLVQIWECALNWFIVELVYKRLVDIFHLCSLEATYLKHVFVLIHVRKRFSVDMENFMTLKHNILT